MEYRDDDGDSGDSETTDQERSTGFVDEEDVEAEMKNMAGSSTPRSIGSSTSRPSSPDVSIGDDEEENKKRVIWKPSEMMKPSWWPRMLWKEKGTFVFIIMALIFLTLMGTLVDGWNEFSWEAWYSIAVTCFTFYCLVHCTWIHPCMIMLFATTLLLAPEVITVTEATQGFGNSTVVTIGVLFIVAAGVGATGSLAYLSKFLMAGGDSLWMAQLRVMLPVGLVSGFMNNTPLVAMMIPVVENFCRATGLPVSKLMIPLSYSAILGGVLTKIGTSTNLVVIALVKQTYPDFDVDFFEIAKVGSIALCLGLIYILIFSRWLLPIRSSPLSEVNKDPKQYLITLRITEKSSCVGKSIEDAGLRHLRGVFLSEIERHDAIIPAPGPDFILIENDVLLFAGDVHNIADLLKRKGLVATNEEENILIGYNQILMEAVVASHSSMIGSSVMETNFRDKYEAAIISIFRGGEAVKGKVGSIVLQAGDTLLMVGKPALLEGQKSDFVLVTQVGNTPLKSDPFHLILAPLIMIVMVALSSADVTPLLTAALCAMFAMYITGCIDYDNIKGSLNMPVLVTIAASFPLAEALDKHGVASEIADNLVAITEFAGDYGLILGIYIATSLLTAFLTNASSAAVMTPIVVELSKTTDIPLLALVITVMLSASTDMSTPIGYQTNLMVWGPGGYKFLDYTKFGVPLQITLAIVCSAMIWIIYTGDDDNSDDIVDDSDCDCCSQCS